MSKIRFEELFEDEDTERPDHLIFRGNTYLGYIDTSDSSPRYCVDSTEGTMSLSEMKVIVEKMKSLTAKETNNDN